MTVEEATEVLLDRNSETAKSREHDSWATFGWTSTGKYILVAWDHIQDDPLTIRPITAYESLKDGAADMADKKRNHQQTGHSAEDKARHEAIREKLNGRPTPEELMESGAYELPVPHGLVLDAMRLLGNSEPSAKLQI